MSEATEKLTWRGHELKRAPYARAEVYRFSLGALSFDVCRTDDEWQGTATLIGGGDGLFTIVGTSYCADSADPVAALDAAADRLRDYLTETRAGLKLIGVAL